MVGPHIAPAILSGPPWRRRLPLLASVAYVAGLAIWTDGGSEPQAWLCAFASGVVALVAAGRPATTARAVGWGLAVVIASLGPERTSRALDSCAGLGAMVCTAGACIAVASIASGGGLVQAPRSSPVAGVIVAASVWWGAIAARLAPDRPGLAWMSEAARAWSWIALATSAAVLLASTEWTQRRRRLELGMVERGGATRALVVLLVMLLVGAAVAATLGRARADAVARLGVAFVGTLVAAAAAHPDPVRVAGVARRVAVLTLVGGGVALLGASIASGGSAADIWPATLVTAAVALAVGSIAAKFEAPLRPAEGVWLDAFARAAEQAMRPEPEDAIRETLMALRAPLGPGASSPEVWTLAPTRATSVDAAGYLHEREAELPETLVLVAAAEPGATLRAEVLDALETRRPELRPLARWMSERGAMLATVIACDGETEGVLVLPLGGRRDPPTLEEIRSLGRVAERLATACRARGMQSRMLARVYDAAAQADSMKERVERLVHDRALDVNRRTLEVVRLARPATVGMYSAASRMALEQLEGRTAMVASIAIVAPGGADPVPYIARAHLAGARGSAPFVLVDATSMREHDIARWSDPTASPFALADGGMLVLLDAAALPSDVQQLVARACAEKRAPWGRAAALDVELAITGVAAPDDLVAQGRLDPSLAQQLGDARKVPVTLPRLRERPEDLRAILTDRLAREGLRTLGRPVGLEPSACARLTEYEFPGEDAELTAIVLRLVGSCTGDVVRGAEVDALKLRYSEGPAWGEPPAIPSKQQLDQPAPRKDPLSA
jgi:hypothetical protein